MSKVLPLVRATAFASGTANSDSSQLDPYRVDPFNWKLLLSRTTSIKSPSVLAVFTSRKLMSRFSGASLLDFVINSRA